MLVSINHIELRTAPARGFRERHVVIAQLDQDDASFSEQIKYLEELQTPVLVHNDHIRDPAAFKSLKRVPELLGRIFFLNKEDAALFRLRYNFRLVAASNIYLKATDPAAAKVLDK